MYYHQRGFARETSAVTVVGAEAPHNINDHESGSGEGILQMVSGTVAITGHNNVYYRSEPLLALGPKHATTIARDGYSKADVKRYLSEHATVALGQVLAPQYERRLLVNFPGCYGTSKSAAGCNA